MGERTRLFQESVHFFGIYKPLKALRIKDRLENLGHEQNAGILKIPKEIDVVHLTKLILITPTYHHVVDNLITLEISFGVG